MFQLQVTEIPKIIGHTINKLTFEDLLHMQCGDLISVDEEVTGEGYLLLGSHRGMQVFVPAKVVKRGTAEILGKIEIMPQVGVC